MAGTVTTDLAFFSGVSGGGSQSDCEATTDWSGAPTLDAEVYVQGSNALSAKVSKATFTSVFALVSSVDMSDTLLIAWMNCATPAALDTFANGGMRLRVEDASINWAEWTVAGNDTYAGGWEAFVVRTNQSTNRTESVTPPTYSAITAVGVVCKTTASAAKVNFWYDAVRYGTYMQIYAGTDVGPATWDDFLTSEATNVYGAITEQDGILFVQTPIRMGSTSAGVDTYFGDLARVVVFRDKAFGTGFYEILGQGNSTGDTRIFFGEKSGGAGISGGSIRSAGASKYSFDFSDANIDYLGLYGVSFYDADPSSLPTTSTNREVLDCSFEACGELGVSTCKVEESKFISADAGTDADGAILISSTSHNVSKCSFIACPDGVHIDTAGTYNFTDMVFAGNAYDIGNDSGGLVTINALGTSDPSSYENFTTSTTAINNTVSVSVTAQEADTTKVELARVLLEAAPTGDLPSDASVTITRVTTTASVAHTGHGLSNGDKVAIRGANQGEYNGIQTISNVTTNAYDYTVAGSPVTPATGTIASTAVILDGATNASGIVSRADFNYTSTQPVRGVVRKGTATPYFKTAPLTGSIIADVGFSTTAVLTPDE